MVRWFLLVVSLAGLVMAVGEPAKDDTRDDRLAICPECGCPALAYIVREMESRR